MTNREFYKEQILDIVCNGNRFAVKKNTNEPCACDCSMSCRDCLFDGKTCSVMTKEWCNREYVEPCPFEEGELVEVSDDKERWYLGYFSRIDNDDEHKYLTFCSDNTRRNYHWKYCQKYGTLGGLIKGSEKNDQSIR